MAEPAAPTLAPERKSSDVITTLSPQAAPENRDKEALFDQLVHGQIEGEPESASNPWQAFFTGVLWTGYAVAIVVAIVLVGSATNGLLRALPH